MNNENSMDVSIYKRLSQIDHILIRPDTYVGSLTPELQWFKGVVIENDKWVGKEMTGKISPAFYKIFDEIVSNASDHTQRNAGVTEIKILYKDGTFTVWNNGKGIPVQIHPDENIYVPELIFGHLLTGSNYDDNEERTGGGRNGYGSKLTNIYSTKFIVNCADGINEYEQVFGDNMKIKSEPKIKKSKKNYTQITFTPDYSRFGLDNLDETHLALFLRRICDITAFTGVKVYLNDNLVPIKNFKDYISLYENIDEVFYEKIDDFLEIGIIYNDSGETKNLSMVNGITTPMGGTHVSYVLEKISNTVRELLEKKHKNIKIKPLDIKSRIKLYLNLKMFNPEFSNQSKEALKSYHDKFPSKPEISNKMINKIMNSEIVESILNYIKAKELMELAKINKQTKSTKVKIEKLNDAYYAGTEKSIECSLYLSEGDSARNNISAGIQALKDGKDYNGTYALRGKMLNVREADNTKIIKSDEISNIVTALGLVVGKKYKSLDELRYGKLVIATDADIDGHHIKGLLINIIHFYLPELLELGFVYEFKTPIIKVPNGKNKINFYVLDDYYKLQNENPTGYGKPEYYKGLGTNNPDDMKLYFSNIENHLYKFVYNDESDMIDMAFNKKRSDERKTLLSEISINLEDIL